ncbi:16S rRNA (uracil(1498)-N(3))-methyltransferase [bacterium]|nr:MAG: 16S rRNA (uracil(1498)-N(3))-methyltransferase [bacterium]
MPRPFKPFNDRRPRRPEGGAPERTSGPCFAPGDPPLEVASLPLGTDFPFDAALARRLIRREVNPKEAFTAADASGDFYRVSVKELTPAGGVAVPYEKCAVSPEPVVDITLACAVLSRQRMLFVAQKATELGVTTLVPLFTEFSVKPDGLEHEKAHGWPGQVVRAAKQCRRSSLPEIRPPMTLDAFLASPLATADLALCLDNVGGEAPTPPAAPERVLLLVGPEGGFSDGERKKLAGKALGWQLGGRVLRAETAVLVGLCAVHLNWGDYA